MPVRQKTKICLISKFTDKDGKVHIHRRYTTKSKGARLKKGNTNSKLILRKYNPIARAYTEYVETKIKWKT